MEDLGTVSIIILIITGLISYAGFSRVGFLERYSFRVDKILVNKEYQRIITSGFLHVSWSHLIFNLITFVLFSGFMESFIGSSKFLLIYLSSLIGGNLLSLLVHKNHDDYSAVGASGAVSGVVFASITLFPDLEVSLLIFPIFIPGWLFGLAYVIYSIYGIKSQRDNIGHEAHLGGAIVGVITMILLEPYTLNTNWKTILLILLPSLAFVLLIIRKPNLLLLENPFVKRRRFENLDHKYLSNKVNDQSKLDEILDKINAKGIDKLSKEDKETLKRLNK